jgi:hypothetical protein
MLRTGFIGSDNLFDKYICGWLHQHSDLRLIVWTDQLRWSAKGDERGLRILSRYRQRAKRLGWARVVDEILYYALYRSVLLRRDERRLRVLLAETWARNPVPSVGEIRQIRATDIHAAELLETIEEQRLDALFSMCIDVLLPESVISAPRLGSYLWHEGITPEYRGVYPAFLALANRDYGKLGYTLLRMTMKLDAGDVFVQGTVQDVDPHSDWPNYIGHKAVLDSLPETERFLKELERGEHKPLVRVGAKDRLYSYPTASALARIVWHRWRRKLSRLRAWLAPRAA